MRDSPLGTPGRSLPPLPITPCNHDGYTKLNFAPATENARQLSDTAYDNFIDFEESMHSDSATHDDGDVNSRYVSSTENVSKVDEVEDLANAVVVVTTEVEQCEDDGLDASGYLKLYHVPSTEDVSRLDDMGKDVRVVLDQSGRGRADSVDRSGCLVLQHAASPKIARKCAAMGNDGLVDTVSLQDDPDIEDSVDWNGCLQINRSPSNDIVGRTENTRSVTEDDRSTYRLD